MALKKVGTAKAKTKAKAGTATTKTAARTGPASKKPAPGKKIPPGRRPAGTKPKKPVIRPGQFVFEAPADFKPFFLEVAVRTEKDGLLGSAIKAIRYQGRYDPQAEDKKKFDLSAYDVPTIIGLQARLSAKTFKTNGQKIMPSGVKERNATEKVKNANTGETRLKMTFGSGYRLPASTAFYLVLRVGRRAADNTITVGLKQIEQLVRVEKNGVKKQRKVLLDKKDPAYRLIAGAKRFLNPAFKEVLLPPKRTRGANKKKADESDDE